MHQSLIEKDTRLHLALESAAIGIWEQDQKTGAIEWDLRSKEIFGFPSDLDLNRALLLSRIHPGDRQAVSGPLTLSLILPELEDFRLRVSHLFLARR